MQKKYIAGLFLSSTALITFADVTEENSPPPPSSEEQKVVSALTTPQGLALGSFKVQPQINLFYGHDDNIYAEHDHERSDDIYGVTGSLDLNSHWDQHKLNLNLGFESGRYDQYNDEDYDDFWLASEGRYDIGKNTNLFGGVSFSKEHEERGSANDQFGDEPTTYTSTQAHAGASQKWGLLSLRLGTTFETLDFDDVDTGSGLELNNDDRDLDLLGAGARLTYKVSPRLQPYVQFSIDDRDYDDHTDDYGYKRSSDGYRVNVGVEGRLAQLISGSAYVGYIYQDYDDHRFDQVNEMDIGGNLKWQVSPFSQITAYLKRTLEESTRPGSSGYLLTTAGVNLEHRLSKNGTLSAHLMVGEEDYQDSNTTDDIIDWGVGYRHFLTKNIFVDASYQLTGRDSSDNRLGDEFGDAANPANRQDYRDYYSNAVFFSIGALLYPVQQTPWSSVSRYKPEFTLNDVDWGGLYLGAQYGQNTLFSEIDGSRGSGRDVGEYGDKGNLLGPFVGYGWHHQNWYWGLEVEYDNANTSANHFKSKDDSQTIQVEKNKSYSGSLRLGYTVPNGALVYSRVGWVRSEFDTYNRVNNQPVGHDDSDWEEGLQYGIGTDIPAGEHLFLRMDYRYTDYDDYGIDYLDNGGTPVSATVDNDETMFRLGIGWRFAKQAEASQPIDVDRDGFYFGLQAGHGSLASDASGTHNDSGGTSTFSGDFADEANVNLGGFLGYGKTFDRWYLSIEAETDASNTDWRHERSPEGRDFSVDKKGSFGLGARLGYLLDNGTLIYARAGAVKTRFNTVWVKGGNRDNDVERDDHIWGNRLGLGAEVPLTSDVSIRFDYTHTNYDSYDFTTSHAQADTMEFDNEETLFRVGLSVSL